MKEKHNVSLAETKCGLCGSRKKELTKTECCNHWICDDVHIYQLFSYERNSCYRNHVRYTLCGYHHNEGHAGRWQECKQCKDAVDLPSYVDYGTNEYNFEFLRKSRKGFNKMYSLQFHCRFSR